MIRLFQICLVRSDSGEIDWNHTKCAMIRTLNETALNELILYVIQLRLKRTEHEQANKTRIQNLCLVHRTRMKSHKCSSRSDASNKHTHTLTHTGHKHNFACKQRVEHSAKHISYIHMCKRVYIYTFDSALEPSFFAAQTFPIPKYIWHLFMFLCIGFRSDRLCW